MFCNSSASSWRYEGPPVSSHVEAFHQQLPDYNATPLISLPTLAKELGLAYVLLKDESHRFGLPAFKILGASWAIQKAVTKKHALPVTTSLQEVGAAARKHGFHLVTASEGNWGRAVARMAKYLRVPATILVSQYVGKATQEMISSEGANVIVVEGDYDVAVEAARKEGERDGCLLVTDFSWEGYEEIPQWVVEGYTTMLSETDRQLEELNIGPATHAIASVGVGSWAQAVVRHYKSRTPSAFVITVEPDSAACLLASLEAGKITQISTGRTIMNGMNCGTVSYTAWDILRQGVDASITVSDLEVHYDLCSLHTQGVENGPCGAAPLTALRKLVQEKGLSLDDNSVVVLYSTEGKRSYEVPV